MTLFMHATLTPVPGRLADLGDTVAWLKKGLERSGLTMRRAWAATSGDAMVDLWELPDANTIVDALTVAAEHPRHAETMATLATVLADEVLRLLSPAPHCPDFRPAGAGRCLQVTYRVGYGGGRAAWAQLPAPDGWYLAGAFETTFGDLCEIIEMWEPPEGADASALGTEFPDRIRDRTVTELKPLTWSL